MEKIYSGENFHMNTSEEKDKKDFIRQRLIIYDMEIKYNIFQPRLQSLVFMGKFNGLTLEL